MTSARRVEKALRPEDGWWKSETGDVILDAAKRIIHLDATAQNAVDILEPVIDAMRGEYGD